MALKFTVPYYKENPFVRPLGLLVIGIVLGWYINISLFWIVLSIAVIGTAYILARYLFKQNLERSVHYKSALLLGLFLFLGMALVQINLITNNKYFFEKSASSQSKLLVQLTEAPITKVKSIKANAKLISVSNNDSLISAVGNIIIYFDKSMVTDSLKNGSQLLLNKWPQAIKNSGNPGAFDYANYSLFQKITHQVFVQQQDFIITDYKKPNWFAQFLQNTRSSILNTIQKNIKNERERGIAEALLIGFKNNLDKDLNQAYSSTGTVHVIAISGLHLGFIYGIFIFLFKLLERKKALGKYLKYIKPIVLIGAIWFFTLLAGGAVSILRSAIMFTCISFGDIINRKGMVINSLCLSAFIILCINPFSLWDVGFQLSHFAVLSIVLFMKPIYNLVYVPNLVLNKIWQLTAVTVSAQILTLPIILYYFHQFPTYFLLANIIVVPLSTLILGVELLLLVFAWWPQVATWVGKLCESLIWCMNEIVLFTEQLPFATISNVQHHVFVTFLLYLLIIALANWLLKKSKVYLMLACATLLLLSIVHFINSTQISKQQKLIVYNIPGKQAIDFIIGTKYQFLGDSSLLTNGLNQNFHLKPARIFHQATTKASDLIFVKSGFIKFEKKVIFICDKEYILNDTIVEKKPEIYVTILSNNTKTDLTMLLKMYNIKNIVVDASNSKWKQNKWQQICLEAKVNCYNVNEEGAYIFQ